MTATNAAPATPPTPATGATAPAAQPAATATPAQGATPETPAAAPATPAAPAKPPPDTKALVEQRKLQKQLEQMQAQLKEAQGAVETLKRIRDPKERWAAAQELGLTYQEYTNHVLADLGAKPDDKPALELPAEVAEKLKKIDEWEAEREKQRETEEQSKAKQAFAEKAAFVKTWLSERVEQFPMTHALDGAESFLQAFLAETQKNEGIPPNDDEFAARYEKSLADQVEKQLASIAATSKGKALMQRLLGVQSAPETEPTTASPKQAGSTPRTTPRAITNGQASESASKRDLRDLSDKELRRRAIERLNSQR